MLSFCGYNFMSDINALDPLATNLNNLDNVQIQNGIFDHFNATRDVTFAYNTDLPGLWDFLTVMDANFNGNINAGNVDFLFNQISHIRVKRRKIGEFEWLYLKEIPINTVDDLTFVITDNLNKHGETYEYALVPTLNSIEGNYITNSIASEFEGVFVCDLDSIYKYYAGVSYGDSEQVMRVGVFEPMGRQYPVVVSNAMTNYQRGAVSGTITQPDFDNTRVIDRIATVKYRKELLDFLTNKRAKVLKDWNGNLWLMIISGSPTVSYDNNFGMGIANVGFEYVELGDAENQRDLYNAGLVDSPTTGG